MSLRYTPGLTVSRCLRHRCRRLLPVSGEVLAQVGNRVAAHDVVARTFLSGDVMPLYVARQLAKSAAEVAGCTVKREGDRIEAGETLARSRGLLGMFPRECRSPVAGT